MLMTVISVQHAFQEESGLAADQVVNTFHFNHTTAGDGDLAALAVVVRNFWFEPEAGLPSGQSLMGTYIGSSVYGQDAHIKMYRLSDPKPRPPIYTTSYSPATVSGGIAGGDTLPTEVAMCLSYHTASPGDATGMVVAAGAQTISAVGRHRGRIYVGPLGAGTLGSNGRPTVPFSDALIRLGKRLYAEALALDFQWGVFSPTMTKQSGGVPQCATIAFLSYDDAWDTQRRRGKPPTVKSTFPVA